MNVPIHNHTRQAHNLMDGTLRKVPLTSELTRDASIGITWKTKLTLNEHLRYNVCGLTKPNPQSSKNNSPSLNCEHKLCKHYVL